MKQPEGFRNETAPRKDFRLKKTLYGLKQANRVWNIKLNQKIKLKGLKRLKYDTCVYYKMENGKIIIVAVYVDGFFLYFIDQGLVDDVKQQMCDDFRMKDLGQAKCILGLRVTRTDDDNRPGAVPAGHESATDEDDETTK